jgi:hypothetical protein
MIHCLGLGEHLLKSCTVPLDPGIVYPAVSHQAEAALSNHADLHVAFQQKLATWAR